MSFAPLPGLVGVFGEVGVVVGGDAGDFCAQPGGAGEGGFRGG